ncbi:MAG: thermonuclease family protein, partial [Candidatus Binatia bacterium]
MYSKSLLILLILLIPAGTPARDEVGKTATISQVIDGDTLRIGKKKKIRLIGVDTPEVHESVKLYRDAEDAGVKSKEIRSLGKKSSWITKQLVEGRRVRLEFDEEDKDRHGRQLAYVYFTMNESDFASIMGGIFVAGRLPAEREYMLNRVLIEYGFAKAMTKFPYRYRQEFKDLERAAQERGLGMWAKAKAPEPEVAPAAP